LTGRGRHPYTEDVSAATTRPAAAPLPFVGRADELRALVTAVADARQGRGRVLLVAGEAGIGKTRLVEHALGGQSAATALWGRCRESQGAPAYWPWIQALRALVASSPAADLRARLGPEAATIARFLPQIRSALPELAVDASGAARSTVDPEQARFQLFDALVTWLGRVCAERPLVLVLDDLHWADSESLLLLRFFAAEIRPLALLVIGTHREIETRQLPGAPRLLADAARLGQRVVLRGLDAREIETMVHGALGAVPDDALHAIERASEGNPFFVKELIALLARDGLAPGATLALPDEVREVIRRRLEPLAAPTRHLLGVAAIIGREFELPLLCAIAGLPSAEAFALLAEAVDAGLVHEVGSGLERYRYAHALVHDTIYDDLPVAERAALHLRAAAMIEELHPLERDAHAAELAQHLFRSEDRPHIERAIGYAIRAGGLAHEALGYEEAAGHFERALEAQISVGRPLAERVPLLLRFGETQIGAGDVEGFRASFLEAARIARELGDGQQLAQAALGFATLRHYTTSDTAKIGLLEEALDALGEEDSVLRARVLGRLASASYYAYPARERDRLSRSAVAVARRIGDGDALSRVLLERYHTLAGPDDVEERLAASLETVRLAEATGSVSVACEAHLQAHVDLLILGDVPQADRELALAEHSAQEHRFGHHRWRAVVARAGRALMMGDPLLAEELAERALTIARSAVVADAALVYAGQVFSIRRAQGRLAELVAMTSSATVQYPDVPIWRIALMAIQAELGELDAARSLLDEVATHDFGDLPRDWGWLASLSGLSDVCALVGDQRRAAMLYDLMAPYARLDIATVPSFWGPTTRYLGLLALVRGDVAGAIAHLEDALARSTRAGAIGELVRAREGLARALLARDASGDRTRARALVDDGLVLARAHGLGGLLPHLEAVQVPPAAAPARPVVAGAGNAAVPRVARLHRKGGAWALECGAESMLVKHTKGVLYLSVLLASPGTGTSAADLEDRDRPARDDPAPATSIATARQQLAELRAGLEEAESWGDIGRGELLRDQIEELAEQVIAGRTAPSAAGEGAAERARLNVSRAIHATLRKIEAGCPALGRHLRTAVRTGSVCSYEPDPTFAVRWEVAAPSACPGSAATPRSPR
jgi:tetratricopeptide (TPR) repeat protein